MKQVLCILFLSFIVSFLFTSHISAQELFRTRNNSVSAQSIPSLPQGFNNTTVITGLNNPTSLQFTPNGNIFVSEKSGLIKEFTSLDDKNPRIIADLRTEVFDFWDRGLLSIAVHPDYPNTPYIYALYTLDAKLGGTPPEYSSN